MGQYRSKPDQSKHSLPFENSRFITCASSMCGWRLTMEDAHICNINFGSKQFGLFAVFDGHGGEEVAKFAEKHFPTQLLNNKNFKDGNYEKALTETFYKIDTMLSTPEGKKQLRDIKKLGNKQQLEQSFAGCTANVALVTDKDLYVANAGDSRSIIVNRGKVQEMSKDHKPQDQIQLKRIQKAGGTVTQGRVNGNLNLSRALGDLQYKENTKLKQQEQIITAMPDIKKVPLSQVQLLVIGCDGIWENKTSQQIGKYYEQGIRNKKGLKQINEKLLDNLLAKDTNGDTGLDNMSLVTVIFKKK